MTFDSETEFSSLLEQSEKTSRPERGDILSGQIVALDTLGLIVDVGQKRDGIVPRAEVDKLAAAGVKFEVGQPVTVAVANPEDHEGNLVLSIEQARQQREWVEAERLRASNAVWEGTITGCNRGGLIVQFGDIRAFVPASHVVGLPHSLPENERAARLAAMVGQRSGFKVIEVNRQRRRLVLSQRNANKEYREQKKQKLFENLQAGQVVKGTVTGLRDFGAFVDLGGADGLIHISEISWQRIKHPCDVLRVGQTIDVEILKIDPDGKRIALSHKRCLPDPWSQVLERYQVEQVVEGMVTRVVSFGAFVDLGDGVEGLLHVSRMGGQTAINEGDEVQVKIVSIEPERQRIGLALLQVKSPAPPAGAENAPPTAERIAVPDTEDSVEIPPATPPHESGGE